MEILVLKGMNRTRNGFVQGQSLIEVVVAVGIITVVLVGVSDLITRSLGLSGFQTRRNIAVNIAQNQLTYYRQQRDLKPTDFFINPNANYSTCNWYVFDTANYVCTITYTAIGTTGVNMKVSIAWKDGDKDITTELSQVLAKPTK